MTVIESKEYPRHKVCGEFVSGRGLETLASIGIDIARLGVPVEGISFHEGSKDSQSTALPQPGIGVSRFRFDLMLAETLQKRGGHIRSSCRFQSSRWEEGFVCAIGRQREAASKWKWYGLKAHASDLELSSDLELHFTDNGYVGLCRVESGKVNVCGLFRRPAGSRGRSPSQGLLDHFTSTPSLRERLTGAKWDEGSVAAVSGLPIGFGDPTRNRRGDEADQFRLGDALSMIPPFTGNGMSLALESASLAVEPLVGYARGELSWAEALASFQRATRRSFQRRLTVANAAQNLLMHSFCKRVFMTPGVIGIWRYIFSKTR